MLNIHVVIACTSESNHLHSVFIKSVDNLVADRIIYEHTDSIAALGKIRCIFSQLSLEKLEFNIISAPVLLK